jgi:hypothetical protein
MSLARLATRSIVSSRPLFNTIVARSFSGGFRGEEERAAEAVDVHRKEREQLEKLAEKLRKGEDITKAERTTIADNLTKKTPTTTSNKK